MKRLMILLSLAVCVLSADCGGPARASGFDSSRPFVPLHLKYFKITFTSCELLNVSTPNPKKVMDIPYLGQYGVCANINKDRYL